MASANRDTTGGGGGIIIGTQPLDYWITNFAFMLPAERRYRALTLLSQYAEVPLGKDDTLFLLDCAREIVECWNG
jgi:hypothetical protein